MDDQKERDQSPAASNSLTPRTRQIRGSLCSSKLDFDIDDLCTLTLRRGRERRKKRKKKEKRRRACAGNFSSRRFHRPSETNFRFSSSIILRRTTLTFNSTVYCFFSSLPAIRESRPPPPLSPPRSLVFPAVVRFIIDFFHSFILHVYTAYSVSSVV